MSLVDIKLSEINQKNKYCMISYVESKNKQNTKLIVKEIRFVVTRHGGVKAVNLGGRWSKGKNPSYKINKY